MSHQRNRNLLSRRRARLEPRSRLLVVCEGKITEPRYLNSLRIELKARLVDIDIVPGAGVPKTLVEHAVDRKREAALKARRLKDDSYLYDEVWCVFDVDQHPNLPQAKQQATANGLRLAISNPCVELWAVLHFQDQFAFEERNRIVEILKRYIPEYVKELPFKLLWPRYMEALKRMQQVEHWHRTRGTEGGNPSTGLHMLTERIRELSKDEQIKRLK